MSLGTVEICKFIFGLRRYQRFYFYYYCECDWGYILQLC